MAQYRVLEEKNGFYHFYHVQVDLNLIIFSWWSTLITFNSMSSAEEYINKCLQPYVCTIHKVT